MGTSLELDACGEQRQHWSCLGMHVPSHGSLTPLLLLRASLLGCLHSSLGLTLTKQFFSKNSTVIKVLLFAFFNATVVCSVGRNQMHQQSFACSLVVQRD